MGNIHNKVQNNKKKVRLLLILILVFVICLIGLKSMLPVCYPVNAKYIDHSFVNNKIILGVDNGTETLFYSLPRTKKNIKKLDWLYKNDDIKLKFCYDEITKENVLAEILKTKSNLPEVR